MTLSAILQSFAELIEQHVAETKATARQELVDAINGNTFETVPRPAARKTIANRAALASDRPRALRAVKAERRKGPIQLCPVPGCKDRAAPVFGMVCSKHRAVPKRIVAKYRAARRAKKSRK